jgi:hypothetical protein
MVPIAQLWKTEEQARLAVPQDLAVLGQTMDGVEPQPMAPILALARKTTRYSGRGVDSMAMRSPGCSIGDQGPGAALDSAASA